MLITAKAKKFIIAQLCACLDIDLDSKNSHICDLHWMQSAKVLFIEMKTYLEPSDVALMQQMVNCQRDRLLIRLLF